MCDGLILVVLVCQD